MSNTGFAGSVQRDIDADGNPTSLAGHVTAKDMGVAVNKAKPVHQGPSSNEPPSSQSQRPLERDQKPFIYRNTSSEVTSYQPTSPETAAVYESIMTWVLGHLCDASHDVIVSATDAILEIIKTQPDVSLASKREGIVNLLELSSLSDTEYNDLVNLCKKITDYRILDQSNDEVVGQPNDEIVGIVFDDEDNTQQQDLDNESELGVVGSGSGLGSGWEGGEIEGNGINDEKHDDLPVNETVVVSKDANQSGVFKSINASGDSLYVPYASIDEFFLQRKISSVLKTEDQSMIHDLTGKVIEILVNDKNDISTAETKLMELFNHEHFELIRFCMKNRWAISFKLKELSGTPRHQIIEQMKQLQLDELVNEVESQSQSQQGSNSLKKRRRSPEDEEQDEQDEQQHQASKKSTIAKRKPKLIDLNSVVFDQGSHLMTNSKVKLPAGSVQQKKKLYDIITVPPPVSPAMEQEEKLVSVDSLPEWARCAFPSSETSFLNRIQSKVYPSAFGNDDNLLLCAPTGAGKTNVAMLAALRVIGNHMDSATGKIHLAKFKIVYIAPLKALVQEQTREFQRRLTTNFGIVVNELTGDSSLSNQQIKETQILVTTPEKWDVITRKQNEYVKLTKLIIIDEIHLLHDERGPVLESIVSRTLRMSQSLAQDIRLVGLSATLPNYKDVATFLRVNMKQNLYYFDASYRPCPLEQQFVGIKETKAIKKLNAMNEACYEKLLECAANKHQVIIFVHSRNDTHRTAKWLQSKLTQEDKLDLVISPGTGTSEILRQEGLSMQNKHLKEIIPTGFGIHHAGLNRNERSTVEDLFAQGHIKVLISTATLAWGVNLPAHTVIIKGTETYSPEKGCWVQLSPQDILQMLGRAGRPRYDKNGEGVIITANEEIQYYLAVLNQQLPIESQLMSKLVDVLNAEIVLGSINNLQEAVEWMGYTYLFIRMLNSPAVYHVGAEYANDKALIWKRMDLCHSALSILDANKLVVYNVESGMVSPTDLGVISSHYYINYQTVHLYNDQLKPWHSEIDLLRIFARSGEFTYVPVRQEEKQEIIKLLDRAPIAIKENASDSLAKINVLLQTYVSKLGLDGFALMADMIYITQSAGRLLRAIYEICLRKNWSNLTQVALLMCKIVDKRMWLSNSPFRQFGQLANREIIRATENSTLPFMSYFALSPAEFGEAFNLKSNNSKLALELLNQFPKLSFNYTTQPITKTLLRIQLEVLPEWSWNFELHGNSETFLVIVEDCNGETILYHQDFKVWRNYVNQPHFLDFAVEITEPQQPVYYVKFLSQRWLHCDWTLPIFIENIQMPKGSTSHFTDLHDIQQIPTSILERSEFIEIFPFTHFNRFQSHVFQSIYNTNANVFIGMSRKCGKTAIAELAILNNWRQNKNRIIYMTCDEVTLNTKLNKWREIFAQMGQRFINKLTGDPIKDFQILANSHLTLCTPSQFEVLSRKWRQRKSIQQIDLILFDQAYKIGSGIQGSVMETAISRMRMVSSQLEKEIRMIGFSLPFMNARDIAEWIGCDKQNIFNFDPSLRSYEIEEIRLKSVEVGSNKKLNSCFEFLAQTRGQSCTIFVPTRSECMDLGISIVQESENKNWNLANEELKKISNKLEDPLLKNLLDNGIGCYYKGMNDNDIKILNKLAANNYLSFILATPEAASFVASTSNVLVYGTQFYDGKEHRNIDYPISTLYEMIGTCANVDSNSKPKVLVMTNNTKLSYYSKFLNEGIPVESFMDAYLHEIFTIEASTRTFSTRQDCIDWLTFTYFYRRLQHNPSFYGVKDTSHLGISSYLSELVENTLTDLEQVKLVELDNDDDDDDEDEDEDDEEITPLDGAMIAGFYNVSYFTMKELMKLDDKTKLKDLLEIATNASEFGDIPLRINESDILEKLYNKLPIKVVEPNFESANFKAFILLEAYFSRVKLPVDLQCDQKMVLSKILSVINACIDTLSSEGHLNALNAMDLSQMIVQGMWNRESPLKQIPHFNNEILERCKKGGVESVYDIMALEDEERDDILRLEGRELEDVANFVNKYPNIDISYEIDLSKPLVHEENIEMNIILERDEEMEDLQVVSTMYPFEKNESWWIVLGDNKTKQLYAIKKTSISRERQQVKLEFTIPNKGHHQLNVWCMCDSYIDADKEIEFEIDVN